MYLLLVWGFDNLSESFLSLLMINGVRRNFIVSENLELILTELSFAEFTVSCNVCMYLV